MLRSSIACVKQQRIALARNFADADKSLFEKAKETVGKATQKVGEAFKDEGAIGKQFQDTKDGAAASAAQKVADATGAESLDKHGKIGKQFTDQGAVGGKVDEAAKKADKKGKHMEVEADKAAPKH